MSEGAGIVQRDETAVIAAVDVGADGQEVLNGVATAITFTKVNMRHMYIIFFMPFIACKFS